MTVMGPTIGELEATARRARCEIVKAVANAKGGHLGGLGVRMLCGWAGFRFHPSSDGAA